MSFDNQFLRFLGKQKFLEISTFAPKPLIKVAEIGIVSRKVVIKFLLLKLY